MTNVLNYIANNWELILTVIFVCIYCGQKIIEFIALPTNKKWEEVKNRLLVFVTDAEKYFGSATGELKLAYVYGKFCEAFPYFKKWVTMDKFKELVNEALKKLDEQLNTKEARIQVLGIPATSALADPTVHIYKG